MAGAARRRENRSASDAALRRTVFRVDRPRGGAVQSASTVLTIVELVTGYGRWDRTCRGARKRQTPGRTARRCRSALDAFRVDDRPPNKTHSPDTEPTIRRSFDRNHVVPWI